ncbi:MAG: branched-chain amino acid ABC transporter permease [Streptomycetaceae bacterium]|jgi:branched-chain amino acid transport system permease protein|nr:MAG: branched-chain amino acid ABC transporter permease [Streptomycetaceae bacterium]
METFILIGITGIGLGALYFLVASGLSLIYGLMGVLNFAHGSFLTVGAFVGFWVASKMGFETTIPEFLLAMIIGGLAAGLFALLIEQLLITRLYERHIDQALVTVGVSLVVGAVLGGWFGNDLRMFPTPMWFLTAIDIGGAQIPADRVIYISTAILLLIGNWALLKFTRIGLIIRAGVENRHMVDALGINVRKAFSTVFFLGGFAAGVGGVLVSVYSNGVSPLIAGSYLIYGFIVVVIGGMGSVPGSFLAAMLIGIIKQFANYYATGLGDFVVVILLAVVLLIRPQGLLGKVRA